MRCRSFSLSLIASTLVILITPTASPAQTTFKILHTFAGGSDGAYPTAAPALDSAGNLWATTALGGAGTGCYSGGCGTVFQLVPSGTQWREKILYDFSNSRGDDLYSSGPLALDAKGNAYGTSNSGGDPTCNCGYVFEVVRSASGWTESVIHTFLGGENDGADPVSGVIRDSAGNLYGTATQAGSENYNGAVFELMPNSDGTWTESIIYGFPGDGGYYPIGPLTLDAAGNLYGTASQGGLYGNGTVFKLTPSGDSWTQTTLYDFTGGKNGGSPANGLAFDVAGNLYGTTQYGGTDTVGNVFKLAPTNGYWNFSMLHSFTGGPDGGYPDGNLAIDTSGNLYGTTQVGGTYQYGTVYKFAKSNARWNETILHTFTNGPDGSYPEGLILGPSESLYGAADGGGIKNSGVVFEITP